MSDLAALAESLRQRLRPGGALLLCDHHPAGEVPAEEDGRLILGGDYFGRRSPNTAQHASKRHTGAVDETFQPYVWPVSDVGAGLRLDEFLEAPDRASTPPPCPPTTG